MTDQNQILSAWSTLVAKAWDDPAYKGHLFSNPRRELEAAGVEVPADYELRVVEDTPTRIHLPFPAQPLEGGVSDLDLEVFAENSMACCNWATGGNPAGTKVAN